MISGWTNPLELQMAHIIPKIIGHRIGYEGTDTINNCVLLSSGLHALLDNFKWTLDIFSITDIDTDSEDHFKAGMIIKHIPKTGQSSLSGCHGQIYSIPVRYFASFYAHHYVYMRMNYTVDSRPSDCFKRCIESPIWNTLKNLTTVTEIKQFLLAHRTLSSDMDLIVGHTTDTTSTNIYLVARHLWSWDNIVCVLEHNISDLLLKQYQDYLEDLHDLEWTPSGSKSKK